MMRVVFHSEDCVGFWPVSYALDRQVGPSVKDHRRTAFAGRTIR